MPVVISRVGGRKPGRPKSERTLQKEYARNIELKAMSSWLAARTTIGDHAARISTEKLYLDFEAWWSDNPPEIFDPVTPSYLLWSAGGRLARIIFGYRLSELKIRKTSGGMRGGIVLHD